MLNWFGNDDFYSYVVGEFQLSTSLCLSVRVLKIVNNIFLFTVSRLHPLHSNSFLECKQCVHVLGLFQLAKLDTKIQGPTGHQRTGPFE